VDFLKTIFKPLFHGAEDVPMFIEVPDLSWIIENNAFWDFCYEHVNYFNHESLNRCITQAGGHVSKVSSAFGGQYIWAEALMNLTNKNKTLQTSKPTELTLQEYRKSECDFKKHLDVVMGRIRDLSLVKEIVVWGMATKGVMYSLHLVNSGIDFCYCVDINKHKQGKYSPLSGLKILSPDDLRLDKDYAIICMNPNYAMEIELQCHERGLKGMLFTPSGEVINPRKG
jgi:hypothetical protein